MNKIVLLVFLLCNLVGQSCLKTDKTVDGQYMELFHIPDSFITVPASVQELQALVKQATKNNKKIALVGAGKSQGGQTISGLPGTYRVSLDKINKMLYLDVVKKEVKVQAGITWRELQDYIDPHGLVIESMQSYNDFSVGGSLSVNVHGQDIKAAPLIKTVKSFSLITSSGDMIEVSRDKNKELFGLVIGGYGLFGIIVDVTLELTDNVLLDKTVKLLKTNNTTNSQDLSNYFMDQVHNNKDLVFISGRFDIGSKNLMDSAIVIQYQKVNGEIPKTSKANFISNKIKRDMFKIAKSVQIIKDYRTLFELEFFERPQKISRANFMNWSLSSLPRGDYILQEYFIPYKNVGEFTSYVKNIVKSYDINLLNISARHVNKDDESFLAYAREDVCAFVFYVYVPQTEKSIYSTVDWTRKLINRAISLNGSYYLPYHLIATQEQIQAAYPNFKEFIKKKKEYDSNEIFTNKLYEQYKCVIE